MTDKLLLFSQVDSLLNSKATGDFFTKKPMRTYGGSALAYACCFGLKSAIVALLKTGRVSLNARAECCKLSGYLPLHAVIANRKTAMVRASPHPHEWTA
jgi:hypothetical protein